MRIWAALEIIGLKVEIAIIDLRLKILNIREWFLT
jgi:hypothetical protein